MEILRQFASSLQHAFRNLLPILITVAVFQALVLRQVPDEVIGPVIGLAVMVVGIALFIQGLELGVFPIAGKLADEFTARGKLAWLLLFGFCLGFAAIIAEPALITIAEQAAMASGHRLDALTLRLTVALAVATVVCLGLLRIILGHSLRGYLLAGYGLMAGLGWLTPAETRGLAYDIGGVATNVVSVPLITGLGLGLAAAIRGRNPLTHGFGLVALALLAPMIAVQALGLIVFSMGGSAAAGPEIPITDDATRSLTASSIAMGLTSTIRDLLPIVVVIAVFQFVILRSAMPHVRRVILGVGMLLIGLYGFVLGLDVGLIPVGRAMAEQLLTAHPSWVLYLFTFAIGCAAAGAEPALAVISERAQRAASGRINARIMRLLVVVGIGGGMALGAARIVTGTPIEVYITMCTSVLMVLTLTAPRYMVALAFDLGAATVSAITVPLVAAMSLGIVASTEGRDPMIDGFGLVALASMCPVILVLLYSTISHLFSYVRGTPS